MAAKKKAVKSKDGAELRGNTVYPRSKAKKPRKAKAPKIVVKPNPEKDAATAAGEPYVGIIGVELQPDNIGNGAFELDWNDKFITNLVRAGYQSKPGEDESIIVDRWFREVCRNVVMENYEQWDANFATVRRVEREDLGDGKTSVG